MAAILVFFDSKIFSAEMWIHLLPANIFPILIIAVTVTALLLSASLSLANDNKPDAPQKAGGMVKAGMNHHSGKEFNAKHMTVAGIKLVNINGATSAELKSCLASAMRKPSKSSLDAHMVVRHGWLQTTSLIREHMKESEM